MPVRRHGPGWEARIQHAGRRLGKTFETRRDAVSWEALIRKRLNDSELGRTPSYTIPEALERWLTGEAAALRSYRDFRNKARALVPFIKGRTLNELADVAEAIRRSGLKDGLAVATINRRLALLRRLGMLAYKRWGWTDRNMGERVQLLPGESPRHIQASPSEVQALIRAAGAKAGRAIQYAALTGLRRGELLKLTPAHFRDDMIVLNPKDTKTGRPRLVPIPESLKDKPFPFDLTEKELRMAWETAREKTGHTHIQFRDLRRTYGSWIVQKTGNLKAAQDLLGHTTSTITAKHYAHLLPSNLREAVATLPDLAGQRRGRQKKKKAA